MIELFKEFTFESAHQLAANVVPGHPYANISRDSKPQSTSWSWTNFQPLSGGKVLKYKLHQALLA